MSHRDIEHRWNPHVSGVVRFLGFGEWKRADRRGRWSIMCWEKQRTTLVVLWILFNPCSVPLSLSLSLSHTHTHTTPAQQNPPISLSQILVHFVHFALQVTTHRFLQKQNLVWIFSQIRTILQKNSVIMRTTATTVLLCRPTSWTLNPRQASFQNFGIKQVQPIEDDCWNL